MVVEIDTDLLIANNLTPDEYTLLYLVYKGRVDTSAKLFGMDAIINCENKLWCKYVGDILEGTLTITLREKFLTLMEGNEDQIAAAIMLVYPRVANRNGQRVSLQKDKKAIVSKINKIVGKKKILAERIVKCIELEVENMKRAGAKAAFLPDLEVYLNQERWKDWESDLDEVGKEEVKYGARLI